MSAFLSLLSSHSAVTGGQGGGKSVLLVGLGLDVLRAGRLVVTNIEISYPPDAVGDMIRLPSIPVLEDFEILPLGYQGKLDVSRVGALLIDEGNVAANSRDWSKNTAMSKWMVNIRKRRYTLVYGVQSFSSLDSQIRKNYIRQVVFVKSVLSPKISRYFPYHRARVYDNSEGNFTGINKLTKARYGFFYNRRSIQGYYNTEQEYSSGSKDTDVSIQHLLPYGDTYLSTTGRRRAIAPGFVYHAKNWLEIPASVHVGPYHVLKPVQPSAVPVPDAKFSFLFSKKFFFIVFAILFVLYFFSGSKEVSPVSPVASSKFSKPSANSNCSFFELVGPVSSKVLLDDDIFVVMVRDSALNFEISNFYDDGYGPVFTVLFFKQSQLYFSISSLEMSQQGWAFYYWPHGLVLKKGLISILIQGDKIKSGSSVSSSSGFLSSFTSSVTK